MVKILCDCVNLKTVHFLYQVIQSATTTFSAANWQLVRTLQQMMRDLTINQKQSAAVADNANAI